MKKLPRPNYENNINILALLGRVQIPVLKYKMKYMNKTSSQEKYIKILNTFSYIIPTVRNYHYLLIKNIKNILNIIIKK